MRLHDIALHFNVSDMTVSRAFNHPHRVEPELCAQIIAYAQQVGYHPDLASRSLAARRHAEGAQHALRMVLVRLGSQEHLVRDVLSEDLYQGMVAACAQAKLQLEVISHPLGDELDRTMRAFTQRRDIGGLLVDARGDDLDRVEFPPDIPIAVVFGHAGKKIFPTIDIDRSLGVDLVTAAVERSGCRRPGFIGMQQISSASRHAYADGFARSWPAAGLNAVPAFMPTDYTWNGLGEWIEANKPDAIISLTPPIMVNLLRDVGVRIPQDLAFMSLDVGPGEAFCAGLSCRRKDLAHLGVYMLLHDGHLAGAPDMNGIRLLIPPSWRDGASLTR